MESYLVQREVQATDKDVVFNQLDVDKWHKRVKCLLKSESLTKAIKYWSQKSCDKPAVDSGISSSECSFPSLATRTSAFVNFFDGYGDNTETFEMQETSSKTASCVPPPIFSQSYWKKMCKRIRKFEKSVAEYTKNSPAESYSSSFLPPFQKGDHTLTVQQLLYEPKLRTVTLEPKVKSVNVKRKPNLLIADRHLQRKDTSKFTESNSSVTDKSHGFEVESVHMYATQSTQTPESRNSSTSSRREKRLKFRAKIRVLQNTSKSMNMAAKCNASKDILSEKSKSMGSAPAARSRKMRTSISCSKLNRCSLMPFHASSARGNQTYLKWAAKLETQRESPDISPKSSKRSITSQHSSPVSINRKKRLPTSKPSNVESKSALKVKSGTANIPLKSNKSTEVLQNSKKIRSCKSRSGKRRCLQSTTKQTDHISRSKSKKFIKERHDEPSCCRRRESQVNLTLIEEFANERKKTSFSPKFTKPPSALRLRKHLLRLSKTYASHSANQPPSPASPEKSDTECAWDVKMKVDNLLQCHRKFIEWQCNKISETCQNLFAKTKSINNLQKDTELKILQKENKKDENFVGSDNKIREIIEKFMGNKEKTYVDEETSIDVESYEEKSAKEAETTTRNENNESATLSVQCAAKDAELPRQDSSTQTCKIVSKASLSERAHSILIDVVGSESTGENIKEFENKSLIPIPKALDLSASEVWTTETPKLTDEESQLPIRNFSSINKQIMEEVKSTAGLNSKTSSEVFTSHSHPVLRYHYESAEEKSNGSYSDVMSCSSGEIPVEKLRSAERLLDHFLCRHPKIHSQFAATEKRSVESKIHNSRSARRSSQSPARRRPSPSQSRSPIWTLPSPSLQPRWFSPAASANRKRHKSPAIQHFHSFSSCRSSGTSAQLNILATNSSEKPRSRSHRSRSRDRKLQHRSGRSSIDSTDINALMNIIRMNEISQKIHELRRTSREPDHNICFNNFSTSCEHRKTRRVASRNREESSRRRMRRDLSREESRRKGKRHDSAISGERRRTPRDKTPGSRHYENSHDRQVVHNSRRQYLDSPHSTATGVSHRTTSRVPSSASRRHKSVSVAVECPGSRSDRKHFRPEMCVCESSTSGPSDDERPPRQRTADVGCETRQCHDDFSSKYEMTKRWLDCLKEIAKTMHAAEIPYDSLAYPRSKSRSEYSDDKELPSKPWDMWQGYPEYFPEMRQLSRMETSHFSRDNIPGSTSAERVESFCKSRRPKHR